MTWDTITILDGHHATSIPVKMFADAQDIKSALLQRTPLPVLKQRGVKVREVVEFFRGKQYEMTSLKHLDFLVSMWVYVWKANGRF